MKVLGHDSWSQVLFICSSSSLTLRCLSVHKSIKGLDKIMRDLQKGISNDRVKDDSTVSSPGGNIIVLAEINESEA